jgi:hypothetical protein
VNSLKTMTLVAVMAAVAYGVFASLHKQSDDEPPAGVPHMDTSAPMVQMTGPGMATLPETSSSPQFVQSGPVGSVPQLPPGVTAPAAPASDPGNSGVGPSGMTASMAAAVSPLASPSLDASTPPATVQYPSAIPGATPAQPVGSASAMPAMPIPSQPTTGAVDPFSSTGSPAANSPAASSSATALPLAGHEGGVATINDTGGFPPANAVTPASAGGYDPKLGDLHGQFASAIETSRADADTGRLAEAHLELSKWYDQPQLSITEQRQLIDLLDRLAGTVIYSHRHHLLLPAYEARQGDTLESVAKAHQIPATLLAKINGLDPAAPLVTGTALKVLPGPFNAVVDLKNHRLTLFLQGRYAGRFPIGIGRDQAAAPGEFEVQSIIDNPTYPVAADGTPADQSASPFGRYWIDLGNQIGIHGTSNPLSVGRSDGRGCIALKEDDIEHVREILSIGSKVLIRK